MINLATAVDFVESHGDTVEQARLEYLLENQPPSKEVIHKFQSTQREDGGWVPFWATDYSSCIHPPASAGDGERVAETGRVEVSGRFQV